jgi:hypothetical protein
MGKEPVILVNQGEYIPMAIYLLSDNYRKSAKCAIHVGTQRREIPELYELLTEVRIERHRDKASCAVLKLQTQDEFTCRGEKWDKDIFLPGEPIILQAVFENYREEILRGFVVNVKATYSRENGSRGLIVRCQDESLPLECKRVRRIWGREVPVNDRIIAALILEEYGLSLDPESGSGTSFQALRQDDTDMGFLRARAEANDYELLFEGGRVYFGPMRWGAESQCHIEVQKGAAAHCRRFSLPHDYYQGNEMLFGKAEGELDGSRYGHVLQVGKPVKVNGIVESYDDRYYVNSVSHRFTDKHYWQVFTLLHDPGEEKLGEDIEIRLSSAPSLFYEIL